MAIWWGGLGGDVPENKLTLEGKRNQEIVEQSPKDISNAWDSDMLEARSASGIFIYMSP